MGSAIEWTDETWNPVRGCTKVSPGCKHCYAETFAERFRGVKGHPYEQGFDLRLVPHKLEDPLHWEKPRRVFVNSMSDLFHADVPEDFIQQVFAVMANAPTHTFQILTKRAQRMAHLLTDKTGPFYMNVRGTAFRMKLNDCFTWPLPNVWLGVSVENQAYADARIPSLLRTPAAVRFVSAEPLLEDLNLRGYLYEGGIPGHCVDIDGGRWHDPGACRGSVDNCTGRCCQQRIDWVIVGGESGTGARPFDLAWARSIVEQCKAAGVPVFVKQLGACAEEEAEGFWGTGNFELRLKHRKGGDPSEWPADLRVREWPRV